MNENKESGGGTEEEEGGEDEVVKKEEKKEEEKMEVDEAASDSTDANKDTSAKSEEEKVEENSSEEMFDLFRVFSTSLALRMVTPPILVRQLTYRCLAGSRVRSVVLLLSVYVQRKMSENKAEVKKDVTMEVTGKDATENVNNQEPKAPGKGETVNQVDEEKPEDGKRNRRASSKRVSSIQRIQESEGLLKDESGEMEGRRRTRSSTRGVPPTPPPPVKRERRSTAGSAGSGGRAKEEVNKEKDGVEEEKDVEHSKPEQVSPVEEPVVKSTTDAVTKPLPAAVSENSKEDVEKATVVADGDGDKKADKKHLFIYYQAIESCWFKPPVRIPSSTQEGTFGQNATRQVLHFQFRVTVNTILDDQVINPLGAVQKGNGRKKEF
ncbi:hypothetical protein J437_LFUL011762 [Ladona fulva]|uniref:Uncharacterized protein n=1 Tax=Ladona fulva TaxID=123851 RepID=A0A8K0KEM1_LADFU|nr:hypothetical protein J437_LFUL011762 [Ladona fulva]